MLIPDHKIEEVRERVDLVALVSRFVELKKSGRSWKGKCPFHADDSPSFYVTPEMRRFKCFGCEAGGDAISFVQRYLGKTFVDAVRDLAREAGVDLSAAEDPAAKERQHLREATDVAHERFKQNLWHPERGVVARRYLESRGVSEEVARAFGLGFAPDAWNEVSDALLSHGILQWGEAAGLVQKRQKADGYYDVFRARLMIPIRSPEGRCIAFGGRLLEDALEKPDGHSGPKYLNSKESRLYNKSEVLYGTDQAKDEIRRRKTAVLVEGYFDCIGLHQANVKHAVALCSTALTPGHLALLARLEAKELVLLLDGDEAGRKAVERLSGPLLAAGVATKVALLPEGDDPDTFARREGEAGTRALLAQAKPLTEHLFRAVLPEARASSFEDKMKGLERLKTVAAQLPVGLTRSAFFAALSDHFGLPAAELETELRGKAPPLVRPVPKPGAAAGPNAPRGPGAGPAQGRDRGDRGAGPGGPGAFGARPGDGREARDGRGEGSRSGPGMGRGAAGGPRQGAGSGPGGDRFQRGGTRPPADPDGPPPPGDEDYLPPPPGAEEALPVHAPPGRAGPERAAAPQAAPRPAERTPDKLESLFVALALSDPRLLQRDAHRVGDELIHTGLRGVLGQVMGGLSPADALAEATLSVRSALERAGRELPPEEGDRPLFFERVCRELKLQRVNELLAHIARETGKVLGASDLTEETRRLLEERVQLLELKRRLMEERGKGPLGTN